MKGTDVTRAGQLGRAAGAGATSACGWSPVSLGWASAGDATLAAWATTVFNGTGEELWRGPDRVMATTRGASR